jgi:hypothetical protein
MNQRILYVILISYAPDIVQPDDDALDGFMQELLLVRAFFYERPFSIPVEFVQETVDLFAFRLDIEDGHGSMATLETSRGGDDLLRRRSRDLVEETEEVFVEEMALGIWRKGVEYLSESGRVSPCTACN